MKKNENFQIQLVNKMEEATKNYIEKGQNKVLIIRTENNKVTVDGDIKSVEDFLNLEDMELVKNVVKMQGTETLKHHGSNFLPKLKAPLDLEKEDKFWKDLLVREQVKTSFWFKSGRKKGKPLWWPSCLCYEKFIHVSQNTI